MIALQLLIYTPKVGVKPLPGFIGMGASGACIGGVSALFGIGGGTLTVPLLSFFGIKIHQAVGTRRCLWVAYCLGGNARLFLCKYRGR